MTTNNLKPKRVYLHKEPTELYKILKFEGLVNTGGEAKMVIAQGLVYVNNQLELHKRKKIMSGDKIHFDGEAYVMCLAE